MRVVQFSPPDITDLEIKEVVNALKSGWITTGPKTKELETKLADYCGVKRAVCLNSATAAEELNLRILGIGEGDEVIVPAYTYTATASAAIHCGAKVIFVDSVPGGYEMDYRRVEAAISSKTRAIIGVDLFGIPADYDMLYAIAESHKKCFVPRGNTELGNKIQNSFGRIAIVADCAHSLGASKNGVMTGSLADFSSFSFHAVKNFTTAEGGAAMWRNIEGIDNEDLYHQYQLYSLHGQSKDALSKTQMGSWEYDIIGPWYKCNMTDIAAAIGLKQLERYEMLLKRRKDIIHKYDEMCDRLGVLRLSHYDKNHFSSGHLYPVRIPGIGDKERRDIIIKLAEMGISTNVHYKPLPMMTAYKKMGWNIEDFPNAYAYYMNLITLPLHTKLTDEDVEYVTEQFKGIVKKYI